MLGQHDWFVVSQAGSSAAGLLLQLLLHTGPTAPSLSATPHAARGCPAGALGVPRLPWGWETTSRVSCPVVGPLLWVQPQQVPSD